MHVSCFWPTSNARCARGLPPLRTSAQSPPGAAGCSACPPAPATPLSLCIMRVLCAPSCSPCLCRFSLCVRALQRPRVPAFLLWPPRSTQNMWRPASSDQDITIHVRVRARAPLRMQKGPEPAAFHAWKHKRGTCDPQRLRALTARHMCAHVFARTQVHIHHPHPRAHVCILHLHPC